MAITKRQRQVYDFLQDFIQRFSAGTRASQVQSRKKALEKLSLADVKRSNIARPFLKRQRAVATHLDPVQIVPVEDVLRARSFPPADDVGEEARHRV